VVRRRGIALTQVRRFDRRAALDYDTWRLGEQRRQRLLVWLT
jgi:hypothetical protein